MTIHVLAILGGVAFLIVAARVAVGDAPSARGVAWPVPAVLAAVFFGFSLVAVATEGPAGFWPEHTRNLWGAQIWFDLLIGVGVAWTLLVPDARSVGIRPLPWLIAVALTGSIGLLAMWSRTLYVCQTRTASSAGDRLRATGERR